MDFILQRATIRNSVTRYWRMCKEGLTKDQNLGCGHSFTSLWTFKTAVHFNDVSDVWRTASYLYVTADSPYP